MFLLGCKYACMLMNACCCGLSDACRGQVDCPLPAPDETGARLCGCACVALCWQGRSCVWLCVHLYQHTLHRLLFLSSTCRASLVGKSVSIFSNTACYHAFPGCCGVTTRRLPPFSASLCTVSVAAGAGYHQWDTSRGAGTWAVTQKVAC